jgi:hypothetical protein
MVAAILAEPSVANAASGRIGPVNRRAVRVVGAEGLEPPTYAL